MIVSDKNGAALAIGDAVTYVQNKDTNTIANGEVINIITMQIVGGMRKKVDIKVKTAIDYKIVRMWADEVVKCDEKKVATNG